MDIFYAGLGGGGDFGGARFFSAWIWGGTISLEKVLGARFFVYNCNPKKNYIIFFNYRFSGIIFCPYVLFPDFEKIETTDVIYTSS